ITIFPWKENLCEPLILEWKEGETFSQVCEKQKNEEGFHTAIWSKYSSYYFDEDNYLYNYFEHMMPFCACFYHFKDHYLITNEEIQDFDDIRHSCVIPYNRLGLLQFMAQELAPVARCFETEI